MSDVANLGIQFTTQGAESAEAHLDSVAAKSAKAEAATDRLAAGNKRAGGAIAQMAAATEKQTGALAGLQRANGSAANATEQLADAAAHAAREQEALATTTAKLNAAHGSAVGSSKALQQATLGMGRQFTDIGVQLAGGQNPFLILTQQLPQIIDGLKVAEGQGLSFKAVLAGMYAEAAPLLAILAPLAIAAAALGSGFALAAQQINDDNKNIAAGLGLTAEQLEKVKNKTVTMGDVAVGTFKAAKAALASAFGDELKSASNAIGKFFDEMATNTVKETKAIVGGFMGAYQAVVATWRMLPRAFGDATVSAAQAALDALAKLVNGAIGLINPLIAGLNSRFKLNLPQLDTVAFGKLRNDYAGQMAATAQAGAAAYAKGNEAGARLVDKALDAVTKSILATTKARILDEAGKAKAVKSNREQADSLEHLDTKVVSFEEKQIRASDAVRGLTERVRTLNDVVGNLVIPSDWENALTVIDRAASIAGRVQGSVDGIFRSLKNRDWASAARGLINAIDGIKKGFAEAKATGDKLAAIQAVAAVAQSVGGAVGGKTGSFISGAAGGAAAGATIGSVVPVVGTAVGAVIGGILGGLGSLFGSSKASKAAKAEAEAQRLAQEQARLQAVANEARSIEIEKIRLTQGALAAEMATRDDILKKMDASNHAAQKELWAAQDDAKTLELGIQLLEAKGNVEEALYQRQKQQLAGLAEADQITQKAIWAEQELTKARDAAALAAEAAADHARAVLERQTTIQDQIDALTMTSGELLAKTRAAETAEAVKLDASLGGLLGRLYGLQDAASAAALEAEKLATANDNLARSQQAAADAAREQDELARNMATTGRGLAIDLLTAMDRESEALALSRAAELESLEASLRPLQELVWAEQDLKKVRDDAIVATKAAADLLEAQRNDAAALVDRARSDLTEAYGREQSEIQATIDKHRSMAQSLREYRRALIPGATAGTAAGYALSKADFERVSTLARLGNEEALGQLQGVSETFREESLKNAKTSLDYLSDLARINDAVRQAEETSTRQASIAEQQLASLNAQVSGLMVVNQSVLTVAQAITALQSAIRVEDSTWGGAIANPGREWGANAEVNKLLARTTGYAGDFGSGGWQAWIEVQDEAVKAKGRAVLAAQGQSYRAGFAVGGVFTSPTDFRMGDQLGQMAEAGPEAIMPLVQTSGGLGVRAVGDRQTADEVRALRAEVATLKTALDQIAVNTGRGARAGEKHLDLFDRVTDGGSAMITEAA